MILRGLSIRDFGTIGGVTTRGDGLLPPADVGVETVLPDASVPFPDATGLRVDILLDDVGRIKESDSAVDESVSGLNIARKYY